MAREFFADITSETSVLVALQRAFVSGSTRESNRLNDASRSSIPEAADCDRSRFAALFHARHVDAAYLLSLDTPRALRRCDGVLTVSETSKQLIVKHYRIADSSIHVVPNAIKQHLFEDSGPVCPSSEEAYLLMVGCSWQHKNAREVLEMRKLWSGRYRLKIVAGHGQYRTSLMRLTKHFGLQERVDFLDNLSDSGLLNLYRGCAALVYPSLMEGFGCPHWKRWLAGVP